MERTNQNSTHRPNATDDGYVIDPASDYFTTDATANHSKRAALIMLMVGGVAFGSFLWLRMRLVSDMPRQAYAEPDTQQPSQQQQPDQPPIQPPIQPGLDGSTKVMDLDDADAAKPYSVNDASGGMN